MARNNKRKHGARNKGPIILIIGLLLSSAILRLALGADVAIAETKKLDQMVEDSPPNGQEQTADQLEREKATPLLAALMEREKAVRSREAKQNERQKALEVAKIEIDRRILALKETEEKLRSTLALTQTAAEDDLSKLTTVYENMKPKDAAALFEAMEADFAAGFLARMRPDSAANIMSGLQPQTAYSISVILAGRNALVPKN